MIILKQHSLTPIRKVAAEALSLKLTERGSTATMSPAEDCDEVTVSTWLRDETEPGKNIVWRVSSVQTAFAARTTTYQMEHAINTLRDTVIFGEHSASTAREAVQLILGMQSDWKIGEFDYDGVSNDYTFDGETLYDALENVCRSLSDPVWTYDMSVYPFKLSIRKRRTDATSEMRASRNLRTITRTIDKNSMYTRLYPIGHDDMHITGEYIEKNADKYGVVSKVETDASIESEEELRRWAAERLENHCEPVLTIEVDGLELAEDTGEAMDRFKIGQYCRVPLLEYGTEILETITALTYQDKIHQPAAVRVTMSNQRQDINISRILADAIKTAGKNARTGTKQGKKDHAWFEDTNDHVSMCAIGIIGTDAQGNPNWTRLSEITVDGTGIHQTVQEIQGENVIRDAKIEINEKAITQEVTDRTNADNTLSGRITVEAGRITQEVTDRTNADSELSGRITVEAGRITQEVTDRTNADSELSGRITVEAGRITQEVTDRRGDVDALSGRITVEKDRITQEVTDRTNADSELSGRIEVLAGQITLRVAKGDVATQLAVECGNVTISGGNLVVDGYVTATGLNASIAKIDVVNVKGISGTANIVTSANMQAADFQINRNGTLFGLASAVRHLQITGPTNDIYTLQYRLFSSDTWYDVGTFSRATTLRVRYGGGAATIGQTCEVYASPQGNVTPRLYVRSTANDAYISTLSGETWTDYAAVHHGQYDAGYDAGYSQGESDEAGKYSRKTFVKGFNTDDSIYYGKLYDSSGKALTSGNYFWYGLGENYGESTANFYRKS